MTWEKRENLMDYGYPLLVLAVWWVMALGGPIACDALTTPPECSAYCELIGKWADTCGKPTFNIEACKKRYLYFDDSENSRNAGLVCWQDSVEWLPNSNAGEFDCAHMRAPRLP